MDFKNKSYKNRVTGDIVTIIDQYQNVAITSTKEKINTSLLANESLFTPVKNNNINESMNTNNKSQDFVDPKQFFDSQKTYNAFADTIKKTDLSKIRDEEGTEINLNSNYNNMPVSTTESAVIFSDPNDEIEELKRKYGATTVSDSVRQQNETFAKILEPEAQEQPVAPSQITRQEVIQNITQNNTEYTRTQQQSFEVTNDPVTSMFRNVKRNLDFKFNLKIEGKIPRLDFIEMMEDSYEISIIDFLAEEFTNKLLSDPSIIRNKVKDEINSMIQKKLQNKTTIETKEIQVEEPKVTKRTTKRTNKKESTEQ